MRNLLYAIFVCTACFFFYSGCTLHKYMRWGMRIAHIRSMLFHLTWIWKTIVAISLLQAMQIEANDGAQSWHLPIKMKIWFSHNALVRAVYMVFDFQWPLPLCRLVKRKHSHLVLIKKKFRLSCLISMNRQKQPLYPIIWFHSRWHSVEDRYTADIRYSMEKCHFSSLFVQISRWKKTGSENRIT